jgi:hypothetical protein
MARIRAVKPEFFSSETVAKLSRDARLTFIGLWTEADDYGRLPEQTRVLKGHLWALDDDVTPTDVSLHIQQMVDAGLVTRYEVDGRRYLHICGWEEHQKMNRKAGAKHPAPPSAGTPTGGSTADAVSTQCAGTAEAVGERKGKEGKGITSLPRSETEAALSTGRDEDEPIAAPPTPETDDGAEARARAAAAVLGRRDSEASPVTVGAPAKHVERCIETRWVVDGPELVALARQHPDLEADALADRMRQPGQAVAQALHPSAAAPPGPVGPCPHCGHAARHHGRTCWTRIADEDLAADLRADDQRDDEGEQ